MADPEAVLDALASGDTLAAVADQFRLSKAEIRRIIKSEVDRVFDGSEMRVEWMLTARRLRRMELAFDRKAVEQLDCAAAIVAIKASERRATLTGANAPPASIVTLMHANASEEQPTTTAKMLEVVRRLRNEAPPEPDQASAGES